MWPWASPAPSSTRLACRTAECIIAVNKNAAAPIFEVATYGITGDLFKVGPMLTEAIAKYKASKA